jgi:hypothetical protein
MSKVYPTHYMPYRTLALWVLVQGLATVRLMEKNFFFRYYSATVIILQQIYTGLSEIGILYTEATESGQETAGRPSDTFSKTRLPSRDNSAILHITHPYPFPC